MLKTVMDKYKLTQLLIGKDLPPIKQNSIMVRSVKDQQTFDELFNLMVSHDRTVVMRAADAVEKVAIKHSEWLQPHKEQLLSILKSADHKEIKWHVALLIPRVNLEKNEIDDVLHILTYWALNKNENKILRVDALQALYDLARHYPELSTTLVETIDTMRHEMIPSIQARIKKLTDARKTRYQAA